MTQEEYQVKLKEWFKQQGGNPGNGMFGKWAWHLKKEKEFKKLLEEQGIEIEKVRK